MNIQIEEDGFLDEEIRCGYTVTANQKKVWAVELDLLKELLRVCKKHNIEVFCFAGTMLGAVRHKGFIPWDDDVDVCLTRENFEKLNSVSYEFRHPYFFQTPLNDQRYFVGYARLRNSDTTGIIAWNNSPDYNNGIYIDVFVLDGYTKSKLKLKCQLVHRNFLSKLLRAYHADGSQQKMGKKLLAVGLRHTLFRVVSYEKLYQKYKNVLTKYNDSADRITLLTHGRSFISRYWGKKEDFQEAVWMPFENIMVPIPKAYDEILVHAYGNYSEFPPIEERGAWHNDMIIFDPDIPYKDYMEKHKGE